VCGQDCLRSADTNANSTHTHTCVWTDYNINGAKKCRL
jgi:hypothetical protein